MASTVTTLTGGIPKFRHEDFTGEFTALHKTTSAPLCVTLASVLIAGAMVELVTFIVISTAPLIVSRVVAVLTTKSAANFPGWRSTLGRPRRAMQ